ncbi:Ras GTPase activating protein ira2, partial [Kickxella alabastrina]
MRVIALGMFYHWHQIYAGLGINTGKPMVGSTPSSASSDDGNDEDQASAAAAAAAAAAEAGAYQVNGKGYNLGDFNLYCPSPLEEPLAKRAFAIISEYFRSWVSPSSLRMLATTVRSQMSYMFALRRTHTSQSVPLCSFLRDIAIGTSMLPKFVRACVAEPTADLAFEIQEAAGSIFMFVSASNWNVAMQRAKSCLYLALSRSDEVADFTDIQFLEFATMDITRLAQVIDAFTDVFVRVKAAEQLKLAIVLRRAIWGFISRCSGTFIDMYRNMYRPQTNRIEQLAEILRTVIEIHSRTGAHPAFHQLRALLLMLCPDIVVHAAEHAIEHGEAREDNCSRQVRYLAQIRQMLALKDVPESILLAVQEVQHVSRVLKALPENEGLRLAKFMDSDINVVLLDSSNRLLPYREEPIESKLLLMATVTCGLSIGGMTALTMYLARLCGPNTEPSMQLVFANALKASLRQQYYEPGGVEGAPELKNVIAGFLYDTLRCNIDMIQTITEQQAAGSGAQARNAGYGRRVPGYSSDTAGGFNASKSVCDMALNVASTGEKVSIIPPNEIAQRVHLVAVVMEMIIDVPFLAIGGNNEDELFESLEKIVHVISMGIQEPSIAIQHLAGQALRKLFDTNFIQYWVHSADIAFAVWTLSLHVMQGTCRAIVHSIVTSSIVQHRQLLQILLDMLVLSNNVLKMSSGAIGASMEMPEYPQFEVAFEIVIMMHMWADDTDITLITQECLRLKTQSEQLMVDAGIPVDTSLSNQRLYQELNTHDIKQAGMFSRLAQMRAMFRTIRKYMRPTAGTQAAWQETYKLWRQMLQVLLMREETVRLPDIPAEREAPACTIGSSSAPTPVRTEKEEKKDLSRRRNVFEKLTGHATKNIARSGSNSGTSILSASGTTVSSMNSTLSPASAAGTVATVNSREEYHFSSAPRSTGLVAAGAQLPAIFKSTNLTISELRTQWRYCTGFLLAAGGACIADGGPSVVDRLGGGDTAELHSLLEHFIGECLKLIVSDDIQLRELAKEGLGNKTHQGIYMLFLDGCLLNMKRFIQSNGEVSVSESRTLFVSQCICIIESLTDRDATDSLGQNSKSSIDFSPVLLTICKYLNAAAMQSANGALQERIRFTRMVDLFLQSPLRQAIVQEVNLRNDMLETFVNWVTELRAMDPRTLRTEEPHMSKLLIDLTTSTMRVLIQILDKLPVKPMSAPNQTNAAQPTDVRSQRSRAYRRYFDFFVRFMSQCRMIEIQEFSTMTTVHATQSAATAVLNSTANNPANSRGRTNRSESFVASTSDVGVGRDIARNIYSTNTAPLGAGSGVNNASQLGPNRFNRELSQNAELLLNIAIKSLTNMLAANLEIGLQYSLSIIYHEDTKLRALFTDMFTTILNQGIDIDSLGGDTADHWKARLVEALVDPGLKLLLGINEVCQVQDVDELGASLINIFESRHQTKILFERIVTVELERTDSAAELFRRNCLATRLLSYYAK